MNQEVIMEKTLDDFWNSYLSFAFNNESSPEYLFRGISNKNHNLVPSIGRGAEENTGGDIETVESDLISEFKRLSVPILRADETPKSEFEWLFLAQHYGLPTRLLDWSSNPLVALYFATEKDDDIDGGVYVIKQVVTDQYEIFDYKTADYTASHKKQPSSLFAIQPNQGKFIFVRPKYSDQRYLNQRSVFSCPSNPFNSINPKDLELLTFKASWKPEIRRRLKIMGISTSFIYPGLAGIASEVKSFVHDPITSGRLKVLTCRAALELPKF